ncbi:uncharacterized protein PAC_17224 [Phialocephala subalpina]|uniref:PNPLA domain-containing protein n=1 Tax=Phialocephala subalpina TaxID=576137 RepID=A0A1L7XQP1_9HELO|nr:uncharacterized protein PAC_17224 [Phialocephala subalpina]
MSSSGQCMVKLLSIDGGGIRGLAALVVLEQLLDAANEERRKLGLSSQEPWQMFDMIGGTSTGGAVGKPLLAPKFKTKPLEDAILKIIATGCPGTDAREVLMQEDDAACKVLEILPWRPSTGFKTLKLWQACRGTSAAITFFESLSVGSAVYSDGGLLYNNPVQLVDGEASEMFSMERDKLIISLGTGVAADKVFNPNLLTIGKALADIATNTQREADAFFRRDGGQDALQGRCFRFDVPGIGDIELDEVKQLDRIAAASEKFLNDPEVGMKVKKCSEQLAGEVYRTLEAFAHNPREASIPSPHSSTFGWLWTDPRTNFTQWLKSGHRCYWIAGNPGTGKSTLMKFILEHEVPKQYCASDSGTIQFAVIHYFFYQLSTLSTKQEKSIDGLLHAILLQLINRFPQLIQFIDTVYQRRVQPQRSASNFTSAWSVDSLKEALMHIADQKIVTGGLLLLIDGFDECEGDLGHHLGFLFSWIDAMRSGTLSIKLCLASRAREEYRGVMEISLEIHQWTRDDISKYVYHKLGRSNKSSISLSKRQIPDRLKESVIQNSQGVFVWVTLVVEDLIRGFEEGEEIDTLQARINRLPQGLEELYSHIVDEIPDIHLSRAYHYFRLLLRAPGKSCTLTLVQFLMAAQDPTGAIRCHFDHDSSDEREAALLQRLENMKGLLKSRCLNLVQVQPRRLASARWEPMLRESVTFIHLTVREFLKKKEVDQRIRDRIIRIGHGMDISPTVDISLMASYLYLLKTQPCYMPFWATQIATQTASHPVLSQRNPGLARPVTNGTASGSQQRRYLVFEKIDENDEEEYQEAVFCRAPDNLIAKFFNYAGLLEQFLGQPQTEYIDELDRVLKTHVDPSWASKWYLQRTRVNIPGLNVLCLAVCWKLRLYLKSKLDSGNRLMYQNTRKCRAPPLLFYAMNPFGWTLEPVDLDILKLLIGAEAPLNATWIYDSREQTLWSHALCHYLCIGTQHPTEYWLDVLQLMLEHDGNPNQIVSMRGAEFTTALHLLVDQYELAPPNKTSEVIEGFKLLFQHGSDQKIKNVEGIRAYEYAHDHGEDVYNAMEHARKSAGK